MVFDLDMIRRVYKEKESKLHKIKNLVKKTKSKMALPKQKFRELIFQILFSRNFLKDADSKDVGLYMQQLKTTKKIVEEAYTIALKVHELKAELDPKIAKASTSYEVERIQLVEMNILRLCLYELLYEKDVPSEVIISEGIRLAKKFSTKESTSFINAILDHLYKNNTELVYTP
jgi:N utilization substance protein B